MIEYTYGDPPEDSSEIPEAGKIVPPKNLDNLPGSPGAGNIDNFGAFGLQLPDWARIRYVLRMTRSYEKPFKINCGDLGWLIVGEEGWKTEKETK